MAHPIVSILLAGALAFVAVATPHSAAAKVLNVEFKFTPFVGDPATQDEVTTVAGTAEMFVNGVPVGKQEVGVGGAAVLFAAREIAPSVWLPVESLGALLHRGSNEFRVVFVPAEAKAAYRAQLRWATVTDEVTGEQGEGTASATNQAAEGVETRDVTGTLVMERTFDTPFAEDLAWHHAPAETALSAADRRDLRALVDARIAAYAPDFSQLYGLMEAPGGVTIDVAEVKRLKCIDAVHAAGLRIVAPPPERFDVALTGSAAVVLSATDGPLYRPADMAALEKVTDPDLQMCAGAALMRAFPPRLVVVRKAKGGWSIVD
jgi:uncharacterized protein (DUF305 family)